MESLNVLCEYLPGRISKAIGLIEPHTKSRITELRLHSGGVCGLTVDGHNLFLCTFGISTDCNNALLITKEEFDAFIVKFCKGSIYSHEATLKDFYIVSQNIRAGLSGKAIISEGKVSGIGEIYSVNIRLPRHIDGCSEALYREIVNDFDGFGGVLIISPPGLGKTTILRDLSYKLSLGKTDRTTNNSRRVCVIDERCEIYMENVFSHSPCDFLFGVPKTKGIEIAARLLSPEFIICDEIASPAEAMEIEKQSSYGIKFICSAHGDSFKNILKKDHIKGLFDSGILTCAYTLTRCGEKIVGEVCCYD